MNTISSSQSITDLYAITTEKTTKALETAKAEKRKKEAQEDSIEISQKALQAFGNNTQGITNTNNVLDNLVTAGTITQNQATAIQSAFQAGGKSIQSSGTYTNRPKNPLDSLVAAGTITQDQEDAIQNAFEAAM